MNITLIGMSGAGKSTAGKALAKRLGYAFVYIDKRLEEKNRRPLQEIINSVGEAEFLRFEEEEVLGLGGMENTVISTGGSIVYRERAMEFLKQSGTILFLEVPLSVIRPRIDMMSRGIIGGKDKTLEEIYVERLPLYQKYADYTASADDDSPEDIAKAIAAELIATAGTQSAAVWT